MKDIVQNRLGFPYESLVDTEQNIERYRPVPYNTYADGVIMPESEEISPELPENKTEVTKKTEDKEEKKNV